jgi:hypothetical protein
VPPSTAVCHRAQPSAAEPYATERRHVAAGAVRRRAPLNATERRRAPMSRARFRSSERCHAAAGAVHRRAPRSAEVRTVLGPHAGNALMYPSRAPLPRARPATTFSMGQLGWVECCFFPKVVLFFPIRIHVHSYACVCIHMHFIVFCMHSDALHSTIWLHSNAFCNHFELLHSSDARRLHSDAFSYLLHSRHVTF